MAMKKTFTRDYLTDELDLPDRPHKDLRNGRIVISDEIVDHSRWSVIHTLVFRLADQPANEAWSVDYSVGATESQDERPWEHEEEVEAILMREVEKTIKAWEPAS
jgi:hypothetical protein